MTFNYSYSDAFPSRKPPGSFWKISRSAPDIVWVTRKMGF